MSPRLFLPLLALAFVFGCSGSQNPDVIPPGPGNEPVEPTEITPEETAAKTGWSHTCSIGCTRTDNGAQEQITRTGRNKNGTPVCKPTKTVCDAGRSAACVNAANYVSNNEPLYRNCTSTSYSACTAGCLISP